MTLRVQVRALLKVSNHFRAKICCRRRSGFVNKRSGYESRSLIRALLLQRQQIMYNENQSRKLVTDNSAGLTYGGRTWLELAGRWSADRTKEQLRAIQTKECCGKEIIVTMDTIILTLFRNDYTALYLNIKRPCHAICYLFKKPKLVFASIEFQKWWSRFCYLRLRGVLALTTATAANTSLLKWMSVFSNFFAFNPTRCKCLM